MNADPKPDAAPCAHEWEFIDESFAHEFGTEVLHSWECQKCGASVSKCPFPDDR